jgi:outer membrane murein-binding lipoprotein Lpp
MFNMTSTRSLRMIMGAAVCAALISGCGNGASTVNEPAPPAASTDISTSVSALVAYMERLIGTDGNTDGVDVNAVTLVRDDGAEPAPVKF